MEKGKSRYFATAEIMDEAFLELLGQKDLPFLSVREICKKAGVSRSTFYLHYEDIGDLLEESAQKILRDFLKEMPTSSSNFIAKIPTSPLKELYLLIPEYLVPYLTYIKAHARVFKVCLAKAKDLSLGDAYSGLCEHVLFPILDRFQVPKKDQAPMIAFCVSGIMALIREWLERDCETPLNDVISLLIRCVPALPSHLVS